MKDILKRSLKSIGMILLMLLFTSFFFSIIGINPFSLNEKDYIKYITIANIILIIIYIIIYRKTLLKDIKDYIKNFPKYLITSLKYWFIGLIIMIIANTLISLIFQKGIAGNEEDVRKFLDIYPLYMLFNTAIYAPLTEELTFRKSIKDAISNKWFFAITSGLVFGLLHVIGYIKDWTDFIFLIPYATLGISFALLYHKTDNIYCPMSMHMMHNLIAVITYLIGDLL